MTGSNIFRRHPHATRKERRAREERDVPVWNNHVVLDIQKNAVVSFDRFVGFLDFRGDGPIEVVAEEAAVLLTTVSSFQPS